MDHTRNGVNHAGQNVLVQHFTPFLVWSEYKAEFNINADRWCLL